MPRALESAEIAHIIGGFRQAATHAEAAGFDGVELHAANGYLLDQFLQDTTNRRTDEYGGSIQNRARLLLEVTDATISVFGKGRVGVHLAPRCDSHDMGDSDPGTLFAYVVEQLSRRGVAFVCARESLTGARLGPVLRQLFKGVYIANEGFTASSAAQLLTAGEADAVAFGKLFIANPDLPRRLRENAPLAPWDSSTFYTQGERGYTDYPALEPISLSA